LLSRVHWITIHSQSENVLTQHKTEQRQGQRCENRGDKSANSQWLRLVDRHDFIVFNIAVVNLLRLLLLNEVQLFGQRERPCRNRLPHWLKSIRCLVTLSD